MECDQCGICKNTGGITPGILFRSLTKINHPVAVCGPDNRFLWVNEAYEKLVGYPVEDLQNHTWMDLTCGDDIAADMASVKSLLTGERTQYTLAKSYRHRAGHEVQVLLTVWRYPPQGDLVVYIAEAPPVGGDISRIKKELEKIQAQVDAMVNEEQRDAANTSQVVNVGNNSSTVIKVIVGAVIALIAAVSYLAYVASWPLHDGGAEPPPAATGKQ